MSQRAAIGICGTIASTFMRKDFNSLHPKPGLDLPLVFLQVSFLHMLMMEQEMGRI